MTVTTSNQKLYFGYSYSCKLTLGIWNVTLGGYNATAFVELPFVPSIPVLLSACDRIGLVQHRAAQRIQQVIGRCSRHLAAEHALHRRSEQLHFRFPRRREPAFAVVNINGVGRQPKGDRGPWSSGC